LRLTSLSSFQVINTAEKILRRTYGDLNQKLCRPSPVSKKSCSGTPSTQDACAIKLRRAPAVFDDPPPATKATGNGPKFCYQPTSVA
jgi:hypothetical protein